MVLRITKQSDYGIVLMTLFAAQPQATAKSARDLAQETGLPLPMVGKILKLLVRDGLLASQRGAKGGYRLSRPPDRITIEEVVSALEGPIAITECTERGPGACRYVDGCDLQPNWLRINQALRHALQGITLLDMTPDRSGGGEGERAGNGNGVARAAAALERMGEAQA
jgi:FeS assembly SUF system regulator